MAHTYKYADILENNFEWSYWPNLQLWTLNYLNFAQHFDKHALHLSWSRNDFENNTRSRHIYILSSLWIFKHCLLLLQHCSTLTDGNTHSCERCHRPDACPSATIFSRTEKRKKGISCATFRIFDGMWKLFDRVDKFRAKLILYDMAVLPRDPKINETATKTCARLATMKLSKTMRLVLCRLLYVD